MPMYNIRNKKTGQITDAISMSISEGEQWELDNPEFEIAIGQPLIHSGSGLSKPDSSFRDLLSTIRKGNSRGISKSTINDFGGSSEK